MTSRAFHSMERQRPNPNTITEYERHGGKRADSVWCEPERKFPSSIRVRTKIQSKLIDIKEPISGLEFEVPSRGPSQRACMGGGVVSYRYYRY